MLAGKEYKTIINNYDLKEKRIKLNIKQIPIIAWHTILISKLWNTVIGLTINTQTHTHIHITQYTHSLKVEKDTAAKWIEMKNWKKRTKLYKCCYLFIDKRKIEMKKKTNKIKA